MVDLRNAIIKKEIPENENLKKIAHTWNLLNEIRHIINYLYW